MMFDIWVRLPEAKTPGSNFDGKNNVFAISKIPKNTAKSVCKSGALLDNSEVFQLQPGIDAVAVIAAALGLAEAKLAFFGQMNVLRMRQNL